ncbi:MAG: glycosyltransferase family 2 protein, partial [Candidatus Desulfofervidaceae bacterium]|nr:glycosyltransferase family 2 protein [Candidatus Desulfofervidaceae bacterium]
MTTLSLCMVVKDEEANLARCLKSVQPAVDEIIVVDTGSTDKTPEIAKQFGAKVYSYSWNGNFSEARNEALKHASGDYIIWLDADECLRNQDLKKLIQLKAEFPAEKNIAYAVKILNYHKRGIPDSAYQTRIFPHIPGVKFEGRIHEQVSFSLEKLGVSFQPTNIKICHLGYLTKELWQAKIKRNLPFLQKALTETESSKKWAIYFYLGMCYLNLGEEDLAHIHFAQALTPDCKKQNPYFYITAGVHSAKILEKTGESSQGIQLLLKLKEEFPKNDFILYHLGEA